MRRLLAVLPAVALAALMAAPAAQALPSRFPANPVHIEQQFGSQLGVAAADLNGGTPVVQSGLLSDRNMTITATGGYYGGYPAVTVQFSNGNYMAAVTSTGSGQCNQVTIKTSRTSNGVVWAWNTITGNINLVNQYCANLTGSSLWSLAGLNSVGSQWALCDDGTHGCAGTYRALAIFSS